MACLSIPLARRHAVAVPPLGRGGDAESPSSAVRRRRARGGGAPPLMPPRRQRREAGEGRNRRHFSAGVRIGRWRKTEICSRSRAPEGQSPFESRLHFFWHDFTRRSRARAPASQLMRRRDIDIESSTGAKYCQIVRPIGLQGAGLDIPRRDLCRANSGHAREQ